MDSPLTTLRDQPHALVTEALGFDATLVASIEQFSALGIDLLGLQVQPADGELHETDRRD